MLFRAALVHSLQCTRRTVLQPSRYSSGHVFPTALHVSGEPELWEKLGFHIENNTIHLGEMWLHLFNDPEDPPPYRLLRVANTDAEDIQGIPLLPHEQSHERRESYEHSNGVYGIDHIVLVSHDASVTEQVFANLGITKKREMKQNNNLLTFYRPGNVTIEVVTPPASNESDDRAGVIGVTFVCKDLDFLQNK